MGDLDVGTKPDYLFTDFFLKAGQNCDRHKHHGQSQAYAQNGDTDDGTREVCFALRKDPAGDEYFGVQ